MTDSGDVKYFDFGFEPNETDYPLEQDEKRASLIGAFEMAFSDSPYGENFDYDLMDGFLEGTSEKDYEGRLAVSDGAVVGFAWGYRVETGQSPGVNDESDFPEELLDSKTDFFDGETYYFEELGVLPDYRDQGIGKELKRQELEKVKQRDDISRGLMRTQYNGEQLEGLELPEEFRDEEGVGNEKKLGLDVDLGFEPVEAEGKPVIQEVELVGTEGADQRIYMSREV